MDDSDLEYILDYIRRTNPTWVFHTQTDATPSNQTVSIAERVSVNASGNFVTRTVFVDNTDTYTLAGNRLNRGDTVLINQSIADIFISHKHLGNAPPVVGNVDCIRLPSNATFTMRTQHPIYAIGTTVNQEISIWEETD